MDLTTPDVVLDKLCNIAKAWSLSLSSTGGATNLEKSRWCLVGGWTVKVSLAATHSKMGILLPDSLTANIAQGDVNTAKKMIRVWLTINGNNTKHLEENTTDKTSCFINKMWNVHLLA